MPTDPSIISLLKLLKELLPPEAYRNIVQQVIHMWESTDPAFHRFGATFLMNWVREFYPQYVELMKRIIERVAPHVLEGEAAGAGAAAGEAAGGAAAAGEAAGGAAAAEGAAALTAVQIAAILAAFLAIIYAGYRINKEANTKLYIPPGNGMPCNVLSPGAQQMARITRVVSVWGIGSRSTLNKAMRAAEADCNADKAKCGTGGCGAGKSCLPTVAVQKVSSFNGFLATRVVLEYTCPCVCQ